MSDALSTAEEVGLRLLELAVKEAPAIGDTLARVLGGEDDTTPLAERVRALLPADGASARALRSLPSADR